MRAFVQYKQSKANPTLLLRRDYMPGMLVELFQGWKVRMSRYMWLKKHRESSIATDLQNHYECFVQRKENPHYLWWPSWRCCDSLFLHWLEIPLSRLRVSVWFWHQASICKTSWLMQPDACWVTDHQVEEDSSTSWLSSAIWYERCSIQWIWVSPACSWLFQGNSGCYRRKGC